MAYVTVDINMDDIDTSELVDEIIDRIKSHRRRKSITPDDKKKIKEELDELYLELAATPELPPEIKTLDDKLKMAHIKKVWGKYAYYEVEQRIPE
jgi:hypothetical protein